MEQEKPYKGKVFVIGEHSLNLRLAELEMLKPTDVILVSPAEQVTMDKAIASIPYTVNAIPPMIDTYTYVPYKDPKNYINGKKLPRRKK